MSKKMIIMRGVPGSGKSFMAQKFLYEASGGGRSGIILSADQFFIQPNGEYVFDVTKLTQAHASCFRRAIFNTDGGTNLIIIDNTNLSAWEISPYVMIANANGYEHEIINVDCSTGLAFQRQTHGVSAQGHSRMCVSFRAENLPPFWNQRTILNDDRVRTEVWK